MKQKTYFFKFLATAFVLLSLLLGCNTVKPVEYVPGQEYTLMVLHTNDHHGTTLAKEGIAGLAERATYIKGIRSEYENVLLLDAGDINSGSALSNMFYAEPDIKAYNMMGYQGVALGNHEFDGTLAKLEKQIEISDFSWLAANIVKENGDHFVEPYIIKDYHGFRVAVVGLTTLRTLQIASPDESLIFLDEIEVAKEVVSYLKEKELVDVIILLGHLGSVEESPNQNTSIKLAQEVESIDLIIDGHSHTKFEEPLYVNGTPIVSANEWGKFVGQGLLKIVDGQVVDFQWQSVAISTEAFPPDEEIIHLIQPYSAKAEKSLDDVVMNTASEFEFGNKLPRYGETALGNLLCDATVGYVTATGVYVDFAIQNGGTIRSRLPAGVVTKGDILTMLPFENYIYVLSLKGEDVIELFEYIGTVKQGAGGFPLFSKEVSYTLKYDQQGNGKVTDLLIDGQPIVPSAIYSIATNDYLAGGGDGYEVFKKCIDSYNTSMLLSEAVVEYAKTLPQPVQPSKDGRIKVVGGIQP